MPQQRGGTSTSNLMRPFVVLALPGMYLLYKYNQYRQQQMETARRRVTERELLHLNTKISSDIVLILESGHFNFNMPLENRFCCQAPLVKHYTDVIANECPKAFIIVCASPIDCMVPLVAMTLNETGWYDPRKVIGSLAVPEMRASTLAAKALGLEPRYTRVPCVGGTEGEALVPLFSKAVEYFDFSQENTQMLTNAVRCAPVAVARQEGQCSKAADLSEAHALASLVKKVAFGLLCMDVPKITGFVETDASHVISPAKYLAIDVDLGKHGICKKYDIPCGLTPDELEALDLAFSIITENVGYAKKWYGGVRQQEMLQNVGIVKDFQLPKHYDRLDDCAVHLTSF